MSLVQLATNESGDANVVVEMESEAVYKLTDKHTTVQWVDFAYYVDPELRSGVSGVVDFVVYRMCLFKRNITYLTWSVLIHSLGYYLYFQFISSLVYLFIAVSLVQAVVFFCMLSLFSIDWFSPVPISINLIHNSPFVIAYILICRWCNKL